MRWVEPDEVDRLNPALAPGQTLGGLVRRRGRLHRPSAQRAGLHRRPVHVGCHCRERTTFTGLLDAATARDGRPDESAGDIATERVVLTGGPTLAAVGALAGRSDPVGGARHQVVVTEPHPDLAPDRLPMVFDVASGIYWRPEEGGVLWGMSNPDEAPGRGHRSSTGTTSTRCGRGWPSCCRSPHGSASASTWAATIDYTPDHLPILGPLLVDRTGRSPAPSWQPPAVTG